MEGLIIFRWTAARSGHEVAAMELADHSHGHFEGLREEGVITGQEWVSNVTGVDGGMAIIRGDFAALAGVTAAPEFGEIHMRGLLHLEHWHWDMAIAGTTVDEVYPGWRQLVGA